MKIISTKSPLAKAINFYENNIDHNLEPRYFLILHFYQGKSIVASDIIGYGRERDLITLEKIFREKSVPLGTDEFEKLKIIYFKSFKEYISMYGEDIKTYEHKFKRNTKSY